MQIVTYPHPTLRHRSQPVKRVDGELRNIIASMFELMYESRGVGLAANQVDLPLRLFVANVKSDPDEGDELVFINPVLSRPKGSEEAEEGCLSFPELYGNVTRPKEIRVSAYDLNGQQVQLDLEGLPARVVQHEYDHLDGVVFTDRMSPTGQMTVKPTLEEFEADFQSRRRTGQIPDDETLASQRAAWEARYC